MQGKGGLNYSYRDFSIADPTFNKI